MTGSAGDLTGPRKAAILMVLLGEEVAAKLFRHLSREEMAAVAREVAALDDIEEELSRQIIEEYVAQALRPGADRGGVELARKLLAGAQVPEQEQHELLGLQAELARQVLGPLADADPAVLAPTLEGEHPQTAALVLLHLPASRAARVLEKLGEESRSKIVLRMVALRRVSGELVGEVASSLVDRLHDREPDEDEEAGASSLDRTAEILQNLKRSDARQLLDQLEGDDPESAGILHERVYSFETLLLADDRGIQELLRQVETRTLALALHEAEEALARKFLDNLSERAAGMLREEMELTGTVRPQDQEKARREILDTALKLEQEDRLVFEEPSGKD